MAEVLCEFPELINILNKMTGHECEVRITKCNTLVANTLKMPAAASEASIGVVNVVEVKCGRKLV